MNELSQPHPLSPQLAVASLKKYIPEKRYRIKLHDLVMEEAKNWISGLDSVKFSVRTTFSDAEFLHRIQMYEESSKVALSLIANGCYWGDDNHTQLWIKVLEYGLSIADKKSGFKVWLNLRLYPTLLLLYAVGIASTATTNYHTMKSIFTDITYNNLPLILSVYNYRVFDNDVYKILYPNEKRYTPISDWLFDFLRELFLDLIPNDKAFEDNFYRFEYL